MPDSERIADLLARLKYLESTVGLATDEGLRGRTHDLLNDLQALKLLKHEVNSNKELINARLERVEADVESLTAQVKSIAESGNSNYAVLDAAKQRLAWHEEEDKKQHDVIDKHEDRLRALEEKFTRYIAYIAGGAAVAGAVGEFLVHALELVHK